MSLRNPLTPFGTNAINTLPGSVLVLPQGWYAIDSSLYSSIQQYDPITTSWLPTGAVGASYDHVYSDGMSLRVANQTSCPVCAVVTNGGSGYISPPIVTPSEGGSKWAAILGSTVASVTVVAGGTNYKFPPLVVIQAPPAPGYQATAIATISGGSVSAITMLNVGAGYVLPPSITIYNDPRDSGGGAVCEPVLANQGKVTGVVCTDHFGGTIVSSGTVPTLAFSGGGGSAAAATAIMCWTVASITVTGGGAGYSALVGVRTSGTGYPTLSPAFTNPRMEGGGSIYRTREAQFLFASTAGTITGQPLSKSDNGLIQGVTSNITLSILSNAAASTVATLTLVPGGSNDTVYIQALGPSVA